MKFLVLKAKPIKSSKCLWASVVGAVLLGAVGVLLYLFVGRSTASPTVTDEPEHDILKNYSYNNDTLIFAQVLLRHGDYNQTDGRLLTNKGERQSFESGQYFRRRYNGLLGENYSRTKVYVYSVDSDIGITSAQTALAGLFPPTKDEIWNDELLWQPIPVRIMPKEQDISLDRCPKLEAIHSHLLDSSREGTEFMEKNRDLIAYWSKMSGKNLTTIEQVVILHRELNAIDDQSDWAKEAIKPNGPMEYIVKVFWKIEASSEMVRGRAGFLLKQILERTAQKINSTLDPDHLLWLYSSHGSITRSILNGFGDFEINEPPSGSSVHFELYKTSENQHYLQLFYRRPDEEYPPPLNLQGLGEKWTLEQFYSAYGNLIPGDYEAECA